MTIMEQFNELRLKVPHIGLQCVQNENSPFCQYTEKSKNCYMTFASYQSEDCMYNTRVFYSTDCVDCTLCRNCELCYWCVDCVNCYNCNFSGYCEQAIDSDFCFYSIGIRNCFGCVGLKQAEYHIFNEKYSKENYVAKVAELKKLPKQEIYRMMAPLFFNTPRAAMYGKNNEDVQGGVTHNSKDCYWAFDSNKLRDCNFVYHCDESTDLWDCSHLGWSEDCYAIMSGGGLNNCMFCYGSWDSNDLLYCELVYNSNDCFLCVGLNHAKYQILNQQYSPEEYAKKRAEIIAQMKSEGSWGKWFPSTYPEVITYGL